MKGLAGLTRISISATIVLAMASSLQAQEEEYAGPIIDMHLHGYTDAAFPEILPPNPATGRTSVVTYAPDMVLRGIGPDDPGEFMDPSSYRELVQAGGVDVACEIGAQYEGLSPSDPAYGPYWALAEELGLPVGIHTGAPGPGAGPEARLRFGNPMLLEDVLAEYPELKVYIMHAGMPDPFSDYAHLMMALYPQLYADIGVFSWMPGTSSMLETFLRKAKRWGTLDRVMFGTDQMFWPEAIGMAVERVNGYDFLTVEEKAGIFYDNAARFLGLSEEEIARHHRQY
jgi:hypothetical protein